MFSLMSALGVEDKETSQQLSQFERLLLHLTECLIRHKLELIFQEDKFEIYIYKIFPPAPCQLFGKTCLLLTFTAVLCRYLFLSLTFPPMVWVGHHSGNSTQCHSSPSPPPSLYHSSFGHRFSKSLFPERLFWASLRWRSGWVFGWADRLVATTINSS